MRQTGYINNLTDAAYLQLRVFKLGYFHSLGPLDLHLTFREVVVCSLHSIRSSEFWWNSNLCWHPKQLNNLETSYFERGREEHNQTEGRAWHTLCSFESLCLSIPGKLILDFSKGVLTNFILFLGSWISICIWPRSQF